MLSIIVPVLDEAATVVEALHALTPYRLRGHEIVVADGGSRDETAALARRYADQVIAAPRGRGAQMNAGAAVARGDILLFLHADTRLPPDADVLIAQGLAQSARVWGRFDVVIAGRPRLLPMIAWAMNRRSRLTGIATGDQGMFVLRRTFEDVGGFADIALMEDIVLSRTLKRIGPPLCLPQKVITSGRRFETHGALRTILTMWRLRAAFWLGADPARLARRYGYVPRS